MKGRFPFLLASFITTPSTLIEKPLPALPLNPITPIDLANAETRHFTFEWAGAITPADKQGKGHHEFWLMNKRAWEGMSKGNIPEPIATLERGKTYIFDLKKCDPIPSSYSFARPHFYCARNGWQTGHSIPH